MHGSDSTWPNPEDVSSLLKKNMRESMSKWNYVIGVREQIGGD